MSEPGEIPKNTPEFLTAAEVHEVSELSGGEVVPNAADYCIYWARELLRQRKWGPGGPGICELMVMQVAAYASQHAPLEVKAGWHIELVA